MPQPTAHGDSDDSAGVGITGMLLACIVAMPGLMPLAVLPLFVGSLIDSPGLNTEAAGAITSLNLLGNALGIFCVSLCLRRFTRHQFVVIGALLSMVMEVGSILLGWSLAGLLTTRLLSGFGAGLISGAASNWLATRPSPDRGFGLLFFMQFFLSALLLYVLPPVIVQHGTVTFYGLFMTSAVVSIICLPIITQAADNSVNPNGDDIDSPTLDKKPIALTLLAIAFFELVAAGIWAFIERLGIDWRLTPQNIGTALSVGTLAGILGSLLVTFLGTRWGRSRPITQGTITAALGLIVFLFGMPSFGIYVTGLVIFNLAWSYTVPYIQGVQASLDPSGRIAVTGMFVMLLAISMGPFIFGFIIGNRGFETAIIFSCVLLAGCWISVFRVARHQDRDSGEPIWRNLEKNL